MMYFLSVHGRVVWAVGQSVGRSVGGPVDDKVGGSMGWLMDFSDSLN